MNGAWANARSILCVRLDNMGDVLMSTPAMRALRQSPQHPRLTLLTSPSAAPLARHLPEVNQVLSYQAPWMKHGRDGGAESDRAMLQRIAALRFDAAVIFTVYSQSPLPAALFCQLAGIPLCLAHCRENPYHLLSDWVPEVEPQEQVRHEVRRQLDLVAAVGATCENESLSFQLDPLEERHALAKLRRAGVDPDRSFVVLHPGATAASRRYPPERFAAVAAELGRSNGCQIVVTGSAAERELAERICRDGGPRAFCLAGDLWLGELGAVLARALLLISNNTGPVHVAAAVGTPVVDLYALTNPQHTPWQVPSRVLYKDVPCRFCYKSVCPVGHHACLRGVTVDEVVSAAQSLMIAPAATRAAA